MRPCVPYSPQSVFQSGLESNWGAVFLAGRAAHAFYRPARAEQCVVMDLLRDAPAWLGVPGDRGSMVSDCGDDGRLFSAILDRRLALGAVPGLGELCQRVEFYDLATQCWLKWRRSSSMEATRCQVRKQS